MDKTTESAPLITSTEKTEPFFELNLEECKEIESPREPRIRTPPPIQTGYRQSSRMVSPGLRLDFRTLESDDSPIKLDPLSREFPSSIPSRDYDMYLKARENVEMQDHVQINSIVTTKDESIRNSRLSNQPEKFGDNICRCIVF